MSNKNQIVCIIIAAIILVGAIIFCAIERANTIAKVSVSYAVTETTEVVTEPYTEPPTEPIIEEVTPVHESGCSEDASPEENIFIYLTDCLGFPEPAACGIISNIAHETGWKFNPKAGSLSGSYGLIQWMGGRLNNLKKWCKKNDKDYNTIQGQLDFMYWELTESDPYGTYDYLMKCTDGEDAAYDAGWYFCFWYERPANARGRANLRGSDAKDYYQKLVVDKGLA